MPDDLERDHIALQLDIMLAVVAVELNRQACVPHISPVPSGRQPTWATIDQGWLEFWRRNAVA